MIRLTLSNVFSEAFLLKSVLYISDENDDDATRSCESAVDIIAASTAESNNPAITVGNIFCTSTINTFCVFAPSSIPFAFKMLSDEGSVI